MDRGINLDTITQGLLAVQKIRQLYGTNLREDQKMAVKADRVEILEDTLKTISQIMPSGGGGMLVGALLESKRYSSAYRDIKKHVREHRSGRTDLNQVLRTLKVVHPVLDTRQKVYMDKMIKIMEIITS